jgi:hypothetical protein
MSYPVPEVRQTYTAQQSAFYVVSLGMGQDPMRHRQLDFADPNRSEAQRVLPSMALALGYRQAHSDSRSQYFWATRSALKYGVTDPFARASA